MNIKKKLLSGNFNYIYKTILSYCFKCRKYTKSKSPKVVKTKNGRIMLSSNYAVCGSKKSRFIKDQEASGLLSSLGAFSQILLVGPILL